MSDKQINVRTLDLNLAFNEIVVQYWDALWGWEYMADTEDDGYVIWCGNKNNQFIKSRGLIQCWMRPVLGLGRIS